MTGIGPSVLVVDDEELNRDLIARRLTVADFTVSTAAGGAECLDRLQRERFDLVLLDINMPETDGFEVLRRIRADARMRDMPVVMLTALRDKTSVVKSLELGANDYLVKPFNWAVAKWRVKRLLADRDSAPAGLKPREPVANSHILIVDDDELNRQLLTQRVQSVGHRAHLAGSGDEALELLGRQQVDLIMLDIVMPGMDGFALLQKIKAIPAWVDIPVLMVSALDDSKTMVRCLEGGAEDYVTKPYHAVVLGKRIQSCLSARQARERHNRRQQRLQELAKLGERIRLGADMTDERA